MLLTIFHTNGLSVMEMLKMNVTKLPAYLESLELRQNAKLEFQEVRQLSIMVEATKNTMNAKKYILVLHG